MHRTHTDRPIRLLRLIWFGGLMVLTVLSLAAIGLLATGRMFFGALGLALCGFAWWQALRFLDTDNDNEIDTLSPARILDLIGARLQPLQANLHNTVSLKRITPDWAIDATEQKAVPVDAVTSTSVSSMPLSTMTVLIVGALAGALIGVLIARVWATLPIWVLLLGIGAMAALAGAVLGWWQLVRTGQDALALKLGAWLAFGVSAGVFAFTRFVQIADFPIYFFTDEAINTVSAETLLRNGLRDASGALLPPYFQNGQYWNLSLSVYVQVVATVLFGKSVEITRGASAFFALLGACALALTMKYAFGQRWWWLVVLFFGAMPAWFLHSRTAFETALMVAGYCGFLLFYLLYRTRNARFLLPAILCGAATFYAYTNGQAVMLVSGALLLISDARYHLKHWRVGLMGVGLIAVCALPYLRFRAEHPDAMLNQLRILDSYWFEPLSTPDKVARFVSEYAYGLSPMYWFLPNGRDLDRHKMAEYGHLGLWTLPFFLAGIYVCLRNLKSPIHRAVLIALLAAPFGAAIAQVVVTRALAFVVPAAMLCALGAEWLIERIHAPRTHTLAGIGAFVGLACISLWMWRDAVSNGPLWFTNYGLYGMQWGARQLFQVAIPAYLLNNPTQRLIVSPSWANGTDVFLPYFDVDTGRVTLRNIDHYIQRKQPLDPSLTFVMLADEVERANASGKFAPIKIERVIIAPDGSPQFNFARVQYADNADAVFDAELTAKQQPITSTVLIAGEPALLTHSRLDMGEPQNAFDGDTFTLLRGESANPLLLEINFATPRAVTGLDATFAQMDFDLKVVLTSADGTQRQYAETYRGLSGEPTIALEFPDAPDDIIRVRLDITQLNPPEEVHIHVREVSLR
jgi:F0F1-type ATP synthase assembly protein I